MSRLSQYFAFFNIEAKNLNDEWKKVNLTDISIKDTDKEIRKEWLRVKNNILNGKKMPELIISELDIQNKYLDDRQKDIDKLKKGLITAEYFKQKWN